MNMKQYMDKDLHHLENVVKELAENVTRWDSDKVFEKAKEMFDAFSRRFSLEDFLLHQITVTTQLRPGIRKFLKRRRELRAILEDVLLLHVDEPDFRKDLGQVTEFVQKHIKYREEEFYPEVINRLPEADRACLAKSLEKRLNAEAVVLS